MGSRIIRSRAPLRIGMAGGGTDVDPYATLKGGLVLNSTINKYAYCSIRPNDSKNVTITSSDYGVFETKLDEGPLKYDGNMNLVKSVMNHFDINNGFDMFVHSEAPPGSGLGGSSTVIVSIISAISRMNEVEMDKYELADLAYRLEREDLGLKGGKQDQYASVFGGFNAMTFDSSGVSVDPLNLSQDIVDELQYCSLLCYTGKSRESAGIIESQVSNFNKGKNEDALDLTKILCKNIIKTLSKGDIQGTGELLKEAWQQKKKFSDKITNRYIDDLYETAMHNGAYGGKVSGAGGGGFMYFICEYDKKYIVAKELQRRGAVITDFMFDSKGVTSWEVKR